jgi:hypothetical protein
MTDFEKFLKEHVMVIPVGFTRKCRECGRVFDLCDPTDADEFTNGHDCEAN